MVTRVFARSFVISAWVSRFWVTIKLVRALVHVRTDPPPGSYLGAMAYLIPGFAVWSVGVRATDPKSRGPCSVPTLPTIFRGHSCTMQSSGSYCTYQSPKFPRGNTWALPLLGDPVTHLTVRGLRLQVRPRKIQRTILDRWVYAEVTS